MHDSPLRPLADSLGNRGSAAGVASDSGGRAGCGCSCTTLRLWSIVVGVVGVGGNGVCRCVDT